MRLRFAPVSLTFLAVIALAVAGCGDKASIEQAQQAAAQKARNTPSPTERVAESKQAAEQEIDAARAEAKAGNATKKPKSDRLNITKQLRAFERVRKRCVKSAAKQQRALNSNAKDLIVESCNKAFTASVKAARAQARLLRDAYPKCLQQAKAETDPARREKIMIGCASIPH